MGKSVQAKENIERMNIKGGMCRSVRKSQAAHQESAAVMIYLSGNSDPSTFPLC
jgi:hypothetical protein